jgi:hypothetical protein
MSPITQKRTPVASAFLSNWVMFQPMPPTLIARWMKMLLNRKWTKQAADYHAILAVLLETLKEVIEEGMVIDIFFKGKVHKNCELVFFIPFVKCNGDEGDKLCCSYRSRGQHVQQLCRYCQCPNEATDDHNADWPYKTEPLLKKLFEQNNAQKLKKLSQICIQNAFHDLCFGGLHNDRGIHGACPIEILHAVHLGIFKYARDCFFAQIGPSSSTAVEINALAVIIGAQFQHQSNRNKPRTKFSVGIQKGNKLMAKECVGVPLVMCALLASKAGQKILRSAKRRITFGKIGKFKTGCCWWRPCYSGSLS